MAFLRYCTIIFAITQPLGKRILCNIVCNNSGLGRRIVIARNIVRNNVGPGRPDVIAPTLHCNMVCNNVGPLGGGVPLRCCKDLKYAPANRRHKLATSARLAALADNTDIVHEDATAALGTARGVRSRDTRHFHGSGKGLLQQYCVQ